MEAVASEPIILTFEESNIDERIISLLRPDEFFIEHAQMLKFYNRFERIRMQGRRIRTTSLAMLGVTGSGKTTLVTSYIKDMRLTPRRCDGVIERPAEIVPLPAATSPNAFFDRILEKYNEPIKQRESTSDKQNRVFTLLKKARTQLLFIDEIHNVLGYGGDRSQEFILNTLKDVANHCEIPFVLLGTEKTVDVFNREDVGEVKNRFPIHWLTPFEKATGKDFREFVAGFEANLPLKKSSDIASNKKMLAEIYKRTNGLVVDISVLMRGAAVAALESKSEKIRLKEISEGWALVKDGMVIR